MIPTPDPNTQSNNPLNQLFGRSITINWEVVVFLLIFALALFTRFYILGERVMSHDESLHTRFSYNLYMDGDFKHTPLMHGPVLFHATAFSYYLFGANDFTSRIYTSVLGVLMVMSPLLFRRWLGRWGTILACTMLLISPLILYYNRYIRHDTPSILFAIIMMWAILMYLNGPPNQRRRAHWLYIIAAAMVLNLGSKETAFIYIAIFGIFLFLYWVVRLIQYFWNVPGKVVFNFGMIGILLGGVLSLGMYIILDIIKFDLFSGPDGLAFTQLAAADQQLFFIWTIGAIAVVMTVVFGTLFWAYRDKLQKIRWLEVLAVVGVMLLVCLVLVVIEERSHTTPRFSETQTAAPIVPGEGGEAEATTGTEITWLPMIAVWALAVGGFIFLYLTRRRSDNGIVEKDKAGRGFWGTMDLFPEFDLIVVIGTLILPWATALIPYAMHATSSDLANFATQLPYFVNNLIFNIPDVNTQEQVGAVALSFLAWLPLMSFAIAFGLAWNWKRWLVAAAIFHIIFAFFFTTIFTNIAGLASGMIYSLGYWLEQQGVRRGSQPQYYYLLIIMPMYEYLPIIGSVLAMLGGLIGFWTWRKRENEADETTHRLWLEAESERDTSVSDDDDAAVDADVQARHEHYLRQRHEIHERRQLTQLPFLIFFSWLAVLNLVGYSLAGEKMPWLGTHLAMPMIFLTAWFFGRIFDRIDIKRLMQNGWLLLLVLPLFIITLIQAILPLFIGERPFAGLGQGQLEGTYSWLAAVGLTSGLAYFVYWVTMRVGWAHLRRLLAVTVFSLLAVITFRASWMASFINYDMPTEFLVYAHAAPAIKTVLDDINELSLRTTDGQELRFAYDNSVSWPYSWYFRDYTNAVFVGENPTVQNLEDAIVVVVGEDKRGTVEPILEDRYYRYEYKRLWWPMQDYFYLNPQRVINTFDFSPDNTQAAEIRQGMFDIWWSRDYSSYAAALEKDLSLPRWPVADTMLVYVRKDFAAQVWEYGVGEGGVANPLDAMEANVCNTNWVDRQAEQEIRSPLGMERPLQLSRDDEGNIYVAEENANRISVFNPAGQFITTLGAETGLMLNRPNSVYVAPDNTLYIVDTWNYRIIQATRQGEFIRAWGQSGTYGFDAPAVPTDAFWGPRDVYVDELNRAYISDTGNKRIRVYDLSSIQPSYLWDIGSGGSGEGELNEPSGIVVHSDGRVFVADTWNRRITVLDREGAPITFFRVRAWYEDRGNRPYLALDESRDLLYVTDPEGGRILVYNTNGECLGSFGQMASERATLGQFNVIGGLTIDDEGNVYISDAGLNRILKFAPFPVGDATNANGEAANGGVLPPAIINDANDGAFNNGNMGIPLEESDREEPDREEPVRNNPPESTAELLPETTAEAPAG